MWARFTPNLRRIITAAVASAGRAGAEEVTPEHLLAAMMSDRTSPAAFMLENAGIPATTLLDQIKTTETSPPLPFAVRLSEHSLCLLKAASLEADRLRLRHIGSEHVLLALTQNTETPAAQSLANVAFTRDRALQSLRAWQKTDASRLPANMSPPPRMSEAFHPVAWTSQMLRRFWGVFVGKSLGHPGFVTDPYPLYRKLRERQPIRRDPLAPVWVIMTYTDAINMLRDPRLNKDPFRGERLPRNARAASGSHHGRRPRVAGNDLDALPRPAAAYPRALHLHQGVHPAPFGIAPRANRGDHQSPARRRAGKRPDGLIERFRGPSAGHGHRRASRLSFRGLSPDQKMVR